MNFNGTNYDSESLMSINNLYCVFNMPKIVEQKFIDGRETSNGLPAYAPRKAFKVDDYESCPINWMHGSSLSNSYFVPIEKNHGFWLDFNRNFGNKKHVAIVISIQGVNPLDAQSMVEGALCLKQYRTSCPIHSEEFKADRYCEKCNYKWVPQNYLATTGTPNGFLWLDGFLTSEGVVRQYYFTEEEVKGVAHQLIGAEKKVYSIGIAFYLSKNPKPEPKPFVYKGGHCNMEKSVGGMQSSNHLLDKPVVYGNSDWSYLKTCSFELCSISTDSTDETSTSYDIAAGAKIEQKVYLDPENLDFWEDKPAGMLYVNYCPSEQAVRIIKNGKKKIKEEGPLAGITVGT